MTTISRIVIATGNASKYPQQLCKYAPHHFAVEYNPHSAGIAFGGNDKVEMVADGTALRVTITAGDTERIGEREAAIADHPRRFAFREPLVTDWDRSEPVPPQPADL